MIPSSGCHGAVKGARGVELEMYLPWDEVNPWMGIPTWDGMLNEA